MTTLDDLTPLQRQKLIGTWVDLNGSTQPHIYLGEFTSNTGIRHGARLFNPTYTDTYAAFEGCTPRPDLPRAWTPAGQPVPGEWEDGHVVVSYDDPDPWILKDAVSIEGLSEGGMSYYGAPPNGIEVKLDKLGEGEGKARRWVGEWEQA